ncbi:hypothetical protein DK847_20260 [Aestuariivirga litoralis]|uniref:YjiS-like domain-containing protein n=2 Tax=Aestuariivirga litoralis TaxID=2650924 RepID=A0A2W2BFR0_9HYPH|nr:hypothetical protein DK847_20260 [Aestuariivirga litoralis]
MPAMTKLSFLAGSVALFARPPRRDGRDAYAQLNHYDDHMLKDIGLSRADVEGLRRNR